MQSLPYGAILIMVAFFRELFGMGTVMGWPVMEYVFVGVNWVRDLFGATEAISYVPNGVMVMPAAAMFLLAGLGVEQGYGMRKLGEAMKV